jgi:hypothetical protein
LGTLTFINAGFASEMGIQEIILFLFAACRYFVAYHQNRMAIVAFGI